MSGRLSDHLSRHNASRPAARQHSGLSRKLDAGGGGAPADAATTLSAVRDGGDGNANFLASAIISLDVLRVAATPRLAECLGQLGVVGAA